MERKFINHTKYLNLNKLIVFILIFIIFQTIPLNSEDYNNDELVKVVKYGLESLNMELSDLWLPQDFYNVDEYRLEIIKTFFDNPLNAFNFNNRITEIMKNFPDHNYIETSQALISILDLKPFTNYFFDELLPADYISDKTGVDLFSHTDLIGAITLRQYLCALLLAMESLEKDVLFRNTGLLEYLFNYADSLIIFSEENETKNPYQLRRLESETINKAKQYFQRSTIINRSDIISIGFSLLKTLMKLNEASLKNMQIYKDSIRTSIINTDLGKIAVGGVGSDYYEGNFIFIIDFGGNDSYNLTNGDNFKSPRNKYFDKQQTVEIAEARKNLTKSPIKFIIDFEGNDRYTSGDYSLGGAYFGVNILLDYNGNDIYEAANISLGTGIFGFGALFDYCGSDIYSGANLTQGSGAFGIGLLIDKVGDDIYTCNSHSQGFGFTKGFGGLIDCNGNDVYLAKSTTVDYLRQENHYITFSQGAGLGYRPIASGGIGIICEYDGNDKYTSDIFGQGTAYWYGYGAIADIEGNDLYSSYQYAQGAGVHLAFGILEDFSGDDVYLTNSVSQGCGHDISFGSLIDYKGNDIYNCESLSLGSGNANSISLFVDLLGEDAYIVKNHANTLGYCDFRRNYGMIGLFIDAEGNDNYNIYKNNFQHTKSTSGIALDKEIIEEKNPSDEIPIDKIILPESVDSLFTLACTAPAKYQQYVKQSREKITALGISAKKYLSEKLSTENPRERQAVEEILVNIKKDSTAYIELLIDSLDSKNHNTVIICTKVLGRKKILNSTNKLGALLSNRDWRIRTTAAENLGRIGDKSVIGELQKTLSDNNPIVRAQAAYSIACLFPKNTAIILKPAFEDKSQIVRNNAIRGILTLKPLSPDFILELLRLDLSAQGMKTVASLINYMDYSKKSSKLMRKHFFNLPYKVRKQVYNSLIETEELFWKEELKYFLKKEINEELRSFIKEHIR